MREWKKNSRKFQTKVKKCSAIKNLREKSLRTKKRSGDTICGAGLSNPCDTFGRKVGERYELAAKKKNTKQEIVASRETPFTYLRLCPFHLMDGSIRC